MATEPSDGCSLQEAFKIFRDKKKRQLKERRRATRPETVPERDEASLERLRHQFLQTALSYCGVPYARRYHEPDSPTHSAPLFLDCCGLVRRVLRDMREDLGFTVGPWNQAYQFDTLPVVLSGPEEMKPGDLVFISATYFNQQRRRQRHNMVHVEIWLGDQLKTVGARWQKGRVEVHDSYQFVSKSYHSLQYHFCSIDTWLKGVCKSFCPEHEWEMREFSPGKYSIFSAEQDESCGDDDEDGGGGGDEEDDSDDSETEKTKGQEENKPPLLQKFESVVAAENVCSAPPSPQQPSLSSAPPPHQQPSLSSASQLRQPSLSSAVPRPVSCQGRSRSSAARARIFLVLGGNAAPLVCQALRERGWVQTEDSSSSSFTLKWTETSKLINYKEFREGEQLVNHFPNISLLTTKIGLLESLRATQRLQQSAAGSRGVRVASFLPETYRLDREDERSEFSRVYSSGELWICKPTGANQGKGIFLVRDLQQVTDRLESDQRRCKIASRPTARIAQRYITPPLLLGGRKFDIRVYLLVVAARQYVVLYADGYVRLSCASYNAASSDLTVHLTNQYQQKKHPDYSSMRDDTVWDYQRLQEQLSKEHGLASDWVTSTLTKRMKAIMVTCFQNVRHKLTHKIGFFDLLGFDFMLDAQLNVWLIEINVNPALHTNCTTLQALVPPLLSETLDIAIEIFDKCRRSRPILPLSSPSLFSVLISS